MKEEIIVISLNFCQNIYSGLTTRQVRLMDGEGNIAIGKLISPGQRYQTVNENQKPL